MFSLRPSFKTLNNITVSSKALLHNYRYFQTKNPSCQIAPVLKSNAYGHGLTIIGKFIASNVKVPFLCVDSVYEAQTLKKAGVSTPILLLGYTHPENFKIIKKLPLSLPVFDTETLSAIAKYQPHASIHVKIDTGMHRLGLLPAQIPDFIKVLTKFPHLKKDGIYSHLSQADTVKGRPFTQNQVKRFNQVVQQFESSGINFKWKHLSATSGALTINNSTANVIRLGLGLYGYSPLTPTHPKNHSVQLKLKPALTFTTTLIQIKRVGEGSQISYGGTFKAKKTITIGIIPVGYYDGLDRRLSNQGYVMYQKKPCAILGRVCMNLTMIDLTQIKNPQVGDLITVIDSYPSSPASLYRQSRLAGTIPYELLVHLAASTRRTLQ